MCDYDALAGLELLALASEIQSSSLGAPATMTSFIGKRNSKKVKDIWTPTNADISKWSQRMSAFVSVPNMLSGLPKKSGTVTPRPRH
jgi:hypothetical protein